MKKVAVIGHYAYGLEYLNGQTIKTKIVTNELCKEYGESEIIQFDTHGGVKTLLKAPVYVWRAMKNTQNIIILPAHNGLRIFGRLLPFFKMFFKKRKIHYVVIGGWLPQFVSKRKRLAKSLKKFDGIYVETNTMKRALEVQGFANIYIMPNCKQLTVLSEAELVYSKKEPYKLCTFSRVMQEKGIEDAINSVKAVNEHFGRTVYTLDIYGQVDPQQTEWFDELKTKFPEYISYGGLVPFGKSVEVLKDYFALLFPTRFYTEGIPGTIIDAYAAGIPVISSKWESFADIIDDNKTGIGFDFDGYNNLVDELFNVAKDPGKLNELKINCLSKSKEFLPSSAVSVLTLRF